MKYLMFAVALLCTPSTSLRANLAILYPVGGEKLPGNGKHIIVWTNSASLDVTLYLDWYTTNGALITSDNALYSEVLSAGTNSFVLYQPARYPTNYQYKVRLVGTNVSINTTSSSGFVKITGPAAFSGTLTNESPWLPGQTRNVTVTWSGFQTNDVYSLILESPVLIRPDYGFLITNTVMNSESGTQTLSVAYPSNPTAAFPPATNSLVDSVHSFLIRNERCDIGHAFGSLDVVTVALRMYLGQTSASYILKGDSNTCALITLDATLATNSVSVTNFGIIFTSYTTNEMVLKFILKDGSTALKTNALTITPSVDQQYHTEVEFPINLTLTAGQIKELSLVCQVLPESGIGSFIWTTEAISPTIFSYVGAKYTNGTSIAKSIVPSTGSYINVVGVVNPKFFLQSIQTNLLSFNVLCKPQTSYILQTSSNLTIWTDFLTTNSTTEIMPLSITVGSGSKFFRLKEN